MAVRGLVLLAEETFLPPFPAEHVLVKVESLLVTPVNLVENGRRPLLGVVYGRRVDNGVEVVSTSFCSPHQHHDNTMVGWSLTPVDPSLTEGAAGVLRDKALQPLISQVLDAVDRSQGSVLVISRGGLMLSLYSALSTTSFAVYAGRGSHATRGLTRFSAETLRGSSWDTVIVMTLDRGLVYDTMTLIESAKRVLYSPMSLCVIGPPLVPSRRCVLDVLSPSRIVDEESVSRINLHIVDEHVMRVAAEELPLGLTRPYANVSLGSSRY